MCGWFYYIKCNGIDFAELGISYIKCKFVKLKGLKESGFKKNPAG
jgi:hypothetical protein